MPHHALGARDGRESCSLPKNTLACQCLGPIVDLGARSMRVDIPDLVDVQLRIGNRLLHAADRTATLGVDVGNSISVGGAAIAEDLAINRRPTATRVLVFFEDHNRCTLSQYKAITPLVKRTGCSCGLRVALGKRCQKAKACKSERMDHRVASTSDHHIGVSGTDQLGRLADGLARGRARRQAIAVGTLGVKQSRHVRRGHVGLLLHLLARIHQLDPLLDESRHAELRTHHGRIDHPGEIAEVLISLTCT